MGASLGDSSCLGESRVGKEAKPRGEDAREEPTDRGRGGRLAGPAVGVLLFEIARQRETVTLRWNGGGPFSPGRRGAWRKRPILGARTEQDTLHRDAVLPSLGGGRDGGVARSVMDS